MNINQKIKDDALKQDCKVVEDQYAHDKSGQPLELVQLPQTTREQRVKETVASLKYIAGGAKRTTNFADVTPKLIVLTLFASGNHPFSHLAKEELGKAIFSVEALKEILADYSEQFIGKVYVGRRKGFMDELEEDLAQLDNSKVQYGPINQVIDEFIKNITLE